jgi:PPOX class probable F420-dependent enzyme
MPNIAQFAGAKYLNLETFRKTGVGVPTPVWFARDVLRNAPTITVFYIYSEADAGKVKRIRNNPKVRVAPCTMRGDVRGTWIDGHARICEDDEAAHGQQFGLAAIKRVRSERRSNVHPFVEILRPGR